MSVPPETTPGTTDYGRRPGMPAMPFPMNPEFLVFLLVWIVIALIWIIDDAVRASDFSILTVALTFGYLVSRGIAKASRVYE